jgi:hypothetical protein
MTSTPPASPARPPLRLWPAVTLAVLLAIFLFVLPVFSEELQMVGFLGAAGCGLLVAIWWMFFSRAPWSERIGILLLAAAALFATSRMVHPSIRGGAMGYLLAVLAVPAIGFALAVAAVASRRLTPGARRATLAAAVVVACGFFTLLRTGGMSSTASDFHWRWTPTSSGPVSAARSATAFCAACASTRTGPPPRPPPCGSARSAQAGRRSR